MSRYVRRQIVAAGAAVGLLLSVPSFASADDEILLTLPVTGIHRAAEGTTLQVASANVPADLVGQSCEIFGSTVNQRSVHPGNDLVIVNGDESFTIPNFEDEGDIIHDAGDVETLAASIQVSILFGPDGVSSGGFRVTLRNCTEEVVEVAAPVETTEPVDATTLPEVPVTESTTTEVTITSTTEADVTTTVAVEEQDPAGPTEESTTTVELAPTTEAPTTVPSTTAPQTSAAPNPLGPTAATDTLPVTGSSTWLVVGFGALLAAAGSAMRFYSSRGSDL